MWEYEPEARGIAVARKQGANLVDDRTPCPIGNLNGSGAGPLAPNVLPLARAIGASGSIEYAQHAFHKVGVADDQRERIAHFLDAGVSIVQHNGCRGQANVRPIERRARVEQFVVGANGDCFAAQTVRVGMRLASSVVKRL